MNPGVGPHETAEHASGPFFHERGNLSVPYRRSYQFKFEQVFSHP
jgi:hypothetical protein